MSFKHKISHLKNLYTGIDNKFSNILEKIYIDMNFSDYNFRHPKKYIPIIKHTFKRNHSYEMDDTNIIYFEYFIGCNMNPDGDFFVLEKRYKRKFAYKQIMVHKDIVQHLSWIMKQIFLHNHEEVDMDLLFGYDHIKLFNHFKNYETVCESKESYRYIHMKNTETSQEYSFDWNSKKDAIMSVHEIYSDVENSQYSKSKSARFM